MVNKYEWLLDNNGGPAQCEQKPLDENRENSWLDGQSPAHNNLREVNLKKSMDSQHYYTLFRHTWELETLHNHMFMYLSAIDYQQHKDRP